MGWGSTELESFLHNMDWVLPLRSDSATLIFTGFSWLGYSAFFLMFLPLGYWFWDRAVMTRLAVLITFTAVTNAWFKDLFHDPRPDLRYQIDATRVGESYGLPSGHAQMAVAMWLWIAHEIRRPWVMPLAVFIAAGVCFSRLYLGVHDVEDVLAGIALGFVCLGMLDFFLTARFEPFRNARPAIHLGAIAAAMFLSLLLWSDADGPGSIISIFYLLFGWVAGAWLDHQEAPAKPVLPAWWIQILMGVAGVIILFAIRAAMAKLGAALHIDAVMLACIISLVLGFYMTFMAPWVFRRLRLMR